MFSCWSSYLTKHDLSWRNGSMLQESMQSGENKPTLPAYESYNNLPLNQNVPVVSHAPGFLRYTFISICILFSNLPVVLYEHHFINWYFFVIIIRVNALSQVSVQYCSPVQQRPLSQILCYSVFPQILFDRFWPPKFVKSKDFTPVFLALPPCFWLHPRVRFFAVYISLNWGYQHPFLKPLNLNDCGNTVTLVSSFNNERYNNKL